MKTRTNIVKHVATKAKSASNTERNARKRIARNARKQQHMLHCLTGTREVPVLDLCRFGGPATVRVVTDTERHAARLLVTGTRSTRAAKFHNAIAAAFEAAGLR